MKNIHCFKIIIWLTIISFSATKGSAMCLFSGIQVFPKTNQISTNSIFVVEGYESSQTLINNLNKKNAIYLVSETDTVKLIVLKTIEGGYNLTQAILKPKSNLIAGLNYKLHIDSLDENEKSDFENETTNWTVSDLTDNQKPTWIKPPSYQSKRTIFYGCGPELYVRFCGCISDNSPTLVYAKIKNLKTNITKDYYITPDSSYFEIGHGMCSGEFNFEKNQAYEATFSIMDASGNISTETQQIKFTSPSEEKESNNLESNDVCDCNVYHKIENKKNHLIWILIPSIAIGVTIALFFIKNK